MQAEAWEETSVYPVARPLNPACLRRLSMKTGRSRVRAGGAPKRGVRRRAAVGRSGLTKFDELDEGGCTYAGPEASITRGEGGSGSTWPQEVQKLGWCLTEGGSRRRGNPESRETGGRVCRMSYIEWYKLAGKRETWMHLKVRKRG